MENNVTTFNAGIRWGGITGGVLILFGLLMYVTGMSDPYKESPLQHIGWIIVIGGVIMGIMYFKDNNEGIMSYGQGVGTATMVGLIAGIISAIWIFIFFKFIDPDMLEAIREFSFEKATESGEIPEEAEENMRKMMNTFTSPVVMSITSVLMYTITGLVVGLIGSAFMKTRSAA